MAMKWNRDTVLSTPNADVAMARSVMADGRSVAGVGEWRGGVQLAADDSNVVVEAAQGMDVLLVAFAKLIANDGALAALAGLRQRLVD